MNLTQAEEEMTEHASSPTTKATESVCPICLRQISAEKQSCGAEVVMVKTCPDHGRFETVLWRGDPPMDAWSRFKTVTHPAVCYTRVELGCPFDCGLCEAHEQHPCSVLLEVTDRCNLRCPVCFADSGGINTCEPDLTTIATWYARIMESAGTCSIQLSGGEPTMREDLLTIIEMGRNAGFSFIQVNTNGIRLANEKDYAVKLRQAGLVSVFLQFDGVDDGVYQALRGRPLLREKLLAVERSAAAGLGVVLVPTLVPGVNTDSLGAIVKKALQLEPAVRGVHFQPVSHFGRYPKEIMSSDRITLPEVIRALEEQTDGLVRANQFAPPGWEHSLCSFHGSFILQPDGSLKSITEKALASCCQRDSSAAEGRTIDLVSRQWAAPSPREDVGSLRSGEVANSSCCRSPSEVPPDGLVDLETFLEQVKTHSFTITCMVFQDAWNFDLERLRQCCISVMAPDGRLIPFCAYNLTGMTGKRLYRNKDCRASL